GVPRGEPLELTGRYRATSRISAWGGKGMNLTRWGWCAALAVLGFLALTIAVAQGWLFGLDHAAMDWVAAQRDCAEIQTAATLSILGAGEVSLLLSGVAGAVWLARRRFRAAFALLLLYV